jgi:hypothetical protein
VHQYHIGTILRSNDIRGISAMSSFMIPVNCGTATEQDYMYAYIHRYTKYLFCMCLRRCEYGLYGWYYTALTLGCVVFRTAMHVEVRWELQLTSQAGFFCWISMWLAEGHRAESFQLSSHPSQHTHALPRSWFFLKCFDRKNPDALNNLMSKAVSSCLKLSHMSRNTSQLHRAWCRYLQMRTIS